MRSQHRLVEMKPELTKDMPAIKRLALVALILAFGTAATFAQGGAARVAPARWTVRVQDSRLTVIRPRGDTMQVESVFDDAFRAGILIMRFVRDQKGAVVAMEVSAGERVRRIRFDRQR
jgi:hypothetical protein